MATYISNAAYIAAAYFVSPWVLVLPSLDVLFTAFAAWLKSVEKERASVVTCVELTKKLDDLESRHTELSLRVHNGGVRR